MRFGVTIFATHRTIRPDELAVGGTTRRWKIMVWPQRGAGTSCASLGVTEVVLRLHDPGRSEALGELDRLAAAASPLI